LTYRKRVLWIVPTPLGNSKDFSYRAVEVLGQASHIILEELKESTKWLRSQGISRGSYLQLNEHTTDEEVLELAQICSKENVALISDAGTPNFCDPGARLIKACRERGIRIQALPGPSSLALILSLSSVRLDHFEFIGFLPAENTARSKALSQLSKKTHAFIIMDTPYRFKKLCDELGRFIPSRLALLGMNLTQENEQVIEAPTEDLHKQLETWPVKPEFMILIYPANIDPSRKADLRTRSRSFYPL
jgi:16S rRNA (cytidine1402-2'-O)-methyltransferase